MKRVIKEFISKLKECFRHREAFSFFLILTDKNEIFDFSYVTGSSARKNNETDYAFGEFVTYHLEHTKKDYYIPPYRIFRYDFSDIILLPSIPEGTITHEYVEKQLVPWLMSEVFAPMKEFDFRQLCFAVQFDVYSLDAVCGSAGIERTEKQPEKGGYFIVNRIVMKDLEQNRSYNFYREMLALQDERQMLCHAIPTVQLSICQLCDNKESLK